MTTEIAHFLRRVEERWEEHRTALFQAGDVERAMSALARDPSVEHLPAMTGARGQEPVRTFFAETLVPHLPADLARRRVSRTVDRFRLVEEELISFTFDRPLPWLLPGLAATGSAARVLAITVAGFERGELRSQRTLWDHATLCDQLRIAPALTRSASV